MTSLSSSPGRESQSGSRAQSSTVGIVLLTAVVVVSVGAGSVLYLGSSGISETASPLVDADVELTPSAVVVTHAGGDPLAMPDLTVVVRADGSSNRHSIDPAAVDGDGDDRFEPAEVWRTGHGLVERTEVVVLVVDSSANAVLVREHATVPRGSTNRAPFASLSVAPGAPESDASAVFDASASVDDEGIVEYRWDWDADGTVDETTTDPRVTHAFPGRDDYAVTLTVVDAEGATDSVTRTVAVGAAVELGDVALSDGGEGDGLVAPGDEVTVTADVAEAGPGVDSVTADAGAFDAGTVPLSDGDDDGTYEGSFTVGDSPAEGDQAVAVTATDDAGNADSATTDPLTVDATAPSIETFAVSDQSEGGFYWIYWEYVESFRVQWTVTDDRLVETTVWVNRSGTVQQSYDGASGDETYENVRAYQGSGRDHTMTVVATDAAGNRACRTVTDTADGTDPPPSAYDSC
ncbi:Protein of unknown function [Halomicrobium zhouii]|uniref:PKD domain-containing protein n=1 Tax=Halomicrobium zhouii TaxID=767519 RepID=A0A1I6KN63_9EURY|nr:PKD domain-containing protein [Halomicrobium zhouii]SFR92656.1 Protein of unknown function [Halomicrobium zhouii]